MTYYNLIKLAEEQKQERDPNALKKGIAGLGAGIGAGIGGVHLDNHHFRKHLKPLQDAHDASKDTIRNNKSLIANEKVSINALRDMAVNDQKYRYLHGEVLPQSVIDTVKANQNPSATVMDAAAKKLGVSPGDLEKQHQSLQSATLGAHDIATETGKVADAQRARAQASGMKSLNDQLAPHLDKLRKLENESDAAYEAISKGRAKLDRAQMVSKAIEHGRKALPLALAGYGATKLYRHFKDKKD